MALTIAAVAAHKGIAVRHLAVSVEGRTELAERRASTRFISRVELDAGLTARERTLLFRSARLCEVHKMLHGDISFEETCVDI